MFPLFRHEVEQLAGEYAQLLEVPRDPVADLALPCFQMAKHFHKSPHDVAAMIAAEMQGKIKTLKLRYIRDIQVTGPYVNFFIDYTRFGPEIMKMALDGKFMAAGRKPEKIMIESPGPNTNKPLHLGHIRNIVLGTSISNIFDALGNKTVKVDIINDRGVHICKSMMAYARFGNGAEPGKKSDHFVGDFYVLFAKELEGKMGTEEDLRQMLLDWEAGDKKVVALWKKMNKWAIDGIHQTYKRMGVRIDKVYLESEHYLDGKKIILDGLKKGIFEKDEEGNIIANLEGKSLGKRVLLRKDGTAVYMTQDIALAEKRYKDYHMDRMIYVVGMEQVDHFKALFEILRLLGHNFAQKCYHLSYGMVNLPEGKMKSREGTVVDADDLIDEVRDLARIEIKKRYPDLKEIEDRSEKIALAAIKFFILKFDAARTITYDPKMSLSFEGDTGPYVLYTYARCRSLVKKSGKKTTFGTLDMKENQIIRKISLFSDAVAKSAAQYNPQIIATYALELCAMFNEYYHDAKIIGSDKESERVTLVASVAKTLWHCLTLLGIEPLEQM